METLRYILRRLLQMIPVLVISVVAIFLLMRLLPGDAALATLGDKIDPKVYEALKEKMGLNASLWDQFVIWVGNMFQGDLGTSIIYKEPVSTLVGTRMTCLRIRHRAADGFASGTFSLRGGALSYADNPPHSGGTACTESFDPADYAALGRLSVPLGAPAAAGASPAERGRRA